LFILYHNFRTRNTRKLIKGSKDSDSGLVSNENFSEILWLSRPGNMSQNGPKLVHLRPHSQKIHTPQPKIFFECRLEDWPIRLSPWTVL